MSSKLFADFLFLELYLFFETRFFTVCSSFAKSILTIKIRKYDTLLKKSVKKSSKFFWLPDRTFSVIFSGFSCFSCEWKHKFKWIFIQFMSDSIYIIINCSSYSWICNLSLHTIRNRFLNSFTKFSRILSIILTPILISLKIFDKQIHLEFTILIKNFT